jgi:hypothetical protein
MTILDYINTRDRARNMHYCAACKGRFDADEMDLDDEWLHSKAMRKVYGAACCIHCTDDHVETLDGVVKPVGDCVMGSEGWYSSDEALADARREASYHDDV